VFVNARAGVKADLLFFTLTAVVWCYDLSDKRVTDAVPYVRIFSRMFEIPPTERVYPFRAHPTPRHAGWRQTGRLTCQVLERTTGFEPATPTLARAVNGVARLATTATRA
jgi:hypothetical protein